MEQKLNKEGQSKRVQRFVRSWMVTKSTEQLSDLRKKRKVRSEKPYV